MDFTSKSPAMGIDVDLNYEISGLDVIIRGQYHYHCDFDV